MKDWKTLSAAKPFRDFWLALTCYDLSGWCVVATLPILIAERFGAGTALVASLGVRILPRIVLAPMSGALLRRVEPRTIAGLGMVTMGALTALLPWCGELLTLQAVVLLIGVLDVFIMPALLTLRAPITPSGLELAANTLFFSADRLAKFAGPIIGGLAVLAGLPGAFLA